MHAPQLAYTPGQLLKKVAQAMPKGLLHLFVLDSETFQPAFSFDPYKRVNERINTATLQDDCNKSWKLES